ncbi:MAG: thioester domain-containing protein [Pseudomonadota bacterium]
MAAVVMLFLTLGAAAPAQATKLEVLDWTLGYQVTYSLYGGKSATTYAAEMDVRLDNFQDVLAYCVDLRQGIDLNTSYHVSLEEPLTHNISTLQAAWLLGHYAPGLDLAPSGYSLATAITALQVAIWEVIYDHADTDLSSGAFVLQNVLSSESDSVRELANLYLQSLPTDITSTGLAYAMVSRDKKHQDLVLGASPIPSAATPEPGSLLLTGSALAMGWSARRWRRRRS